MSKPYFAKYLPVEGEIKEGDWYIPKSSKLILQSLMTEVSYGVPIAGIIMNTTKQLSHTFHSEPLQKVKLFLCSRDIKVGDIVKDSLFNEHLVTDNYMGNKHQWEGNWFKVIGEVSPEAKWVKEGDEFGEDELMAIPGGASVRKPINRRKPEWLGNNTIIEIKGSDGYFH